MKRLLILCGVMLTVVCAVCAQISYGGRPLPLASTRSSESPAFVEMPSFDVEEELRIDSLNESDLRSGYRFAYKHVVHYDRSNSGTSFMRPDGMTVWRLGIHSKDALSINILFSEYDLPEGARVFLYNKDQSQVLGAFTHLNNSELEKLPVSPIQGDELIIEYQEPANAAFHGRLVVGEINHAYRDIRGAEPAGDRSRFDCMPSPACYDEDNETIGFITRSVVLLIIDGSISCTGVLVNNTANDGKPYLLTASHCLNRNFTVTNPDYAEVAGSIVSFFNYESPLCGSMLRGTEEISMASARYVAVNEQTDMALLELLETPPVYYQPYYAGWNISEQTEGTYTGIHHPGGATKRINQFDGELTIETFNTVGTNFDEDVHWNVSQWDVGSTAGGSSGSPLFDKEGLIVGILSGGQSFCNDPYNDSFYALSRTWERNESDERQLRSWLRPDSRSIVQSHQGLNPYASGQAYRLSNVRLEGKMETVDMTTVMGSESIPLFGNNSSGIREYAEEYHAKEAAQLFGAYFVTPSVGERYADLNVEINVYSGSNGPETLLHTEIFQPAYTNKVNNRNSFQETPKPLDRSQESFIRFSSPVEVDGTFYISYNIVSAPRSTYFSVLNIPSGEVANNTTWVRNGNVWTEASAYPAIAFNTSLFIDPVIQYGSITSSEKPIAPEQNVRIYMGAERRSIHVLLPDGVGQGTLLIYDLNGKAIGQYQLTSQQCSIPLPAYPSGVYLTKVQYNNTFYIQKLLF